MEPMKNQKQPSGRLIVTALIALSVVGCADEDPEQVRAGFLEVDATDVGSTADDLYVRRDGLWPNPHVSVCWDPASMNATYNDARGWIREAVHLTFEAVSSIRFVGWNECTTSQEDGTGIRVVVFGGVGGQSDPGRLANRQTRTSIGDCAGDVRPEFCVRALAVHEFGHAMGFLHEHERPDATSRCADPRGNHETYGDREDVEGFLNYCNSEFNGGGLFSHIDIRGLRHYYGRYGWAFDPTLFDPQFYLSIYPDLRAAFGDNEEEATIHWLSMGLPREGRRGNRAFDVRSYLDYHGDLSDAFSENWAQHRFLRAAAHWREISIPSEGRRGSREFDPQYYRAAYGDLSSAFGANWRDYCSHYEWHGARFEGRRASPDFDVRYYLATYPDLQAAFGTDYNAALVHWLTHGIREGRRGAP
jgi:hypothetical protein